MRKIFKLLIVMVVVFSTTILIDYNKLSKIESNSNSKLVIQLIPKSSDNTFWQVVNTGALEAAREFNLELKINAPLNENDVKEQIRIIEEAIEKKVNAIVLAATDYNEIVEVVEKAMVNNIPVIVIDSKVNSDKVFSYIGTNNVEAAVDAANRLVELINGKGKVAIVSFVKGTSTANERESGVMKVFNSNPDVSIVEVKYCLSDEGVAEEFTEEIIRNHPDIDGIIGLNGPSATGVARAISKLGLQGQVKVVGFDNTKEEIDYLEDDAMQATVIQNPYNIGYLGVKYAYNVLNKIAVPREEYTESTLIDKKNIYLPKNQKLLFPFIK